MTSWLKIKIYFNNGDISNRMRAYECYEGKILNSMKSGSIRAASNCFHIGYSH